MKFEKVVLNGVDGIIRINFEGLELPDMGYDPSMYLDFNIKTYQPLHAGRNQEEWDKVNKEDKDFIINLPNFDADIFYECTGIRV